MSGLANDGSGCYMVAHSKGKLPRGSAIGDIGRLRFHRLQLIR